METKHTPGPWAYIVPDGYVVRHPQVYSDTGPVCNATWLGDRRIDELRANARLIAAAPELFNALAEIVAAADGDGWKALDAGFNNARTAIAKATGEA